MKPIKTSVSITIDDPVLKRIKDLAALEDRSLSSYINLVLRKHLKEIEKKRSQNLQNPLDRG